MSSTRIVVAEQGGNSGLTRTFTLADSLFYATQDTVILDWNCYKAYGTASFISNSYLVYMFYQPHDADGNPLAEPMVIGGYVSPWNFPVFGEFSTDALRIGVKYTDVKQAIQNRINLAQTLFNSGGSGDNSRYGNIAFLDQSIKILQNRLKIINKLIDKGTEICILSEASRTINYRKKEIVDYVVFNQGFFDTYYPSSAFPIGSPFQYTKRDSWIERDYFVYNLFKLQKEPILGTDDGFIRILPAHQWSLSPVIHTSDSWKVGLKIVFLRIPSSKKKSRPTENPPQVKPPQVLAADKAAETVIKGLTPGGGDVPPPAIGEARNVAEGIDKGAAALDGAKKTEQAAKYRLGVDDIRKEIVDALVTEGNNIVNKLRTVDVLGRDFEESMDDAIDLFGDMAHLEETGELSGEDYERSKGQLMETISDAYSRRAEEMAQGHKNIDVDSPDIEGSEQEIIDSIARSQVTGAAGDASDRSLKILGEKRKERAQKRLSDWTQKDRRNPDFFKIPRWIVEDIQQMQLAGEDDEVSEMISDFKNKIISEIRAEIKSSAPDNSILNKLFNFAKNLDLESQLPDDVLGHFQESQPSNSISDKVGPGAATLSGKGNVQRMG